MSTCVTPMLHITFEYNNRNYLPGPHLEIQEIGSSTGPRATKMMRKAVKKLRVFQPTKHLQPTLYYIKERT